MGQAVWNLFALLTVFSGVVNLLNAASAWGVVFCNGNLKLAAVWQLCRCLYKTLAVCALAHDNGTVFILQRTAHNLTGAGTGTIYKHKQRNLCVNRLICSFIYFFNFTPLAFCGYNGFTFWQEEVANIYCFSYYTTSIVSEVKNNGFSALLLQIKQSLLNLIRTLAIER